MEYIHILSPLMLELLHHEKRLFYSMNPNPTENICKTFQVTEVYLFMQKRNGEPESSYHSTIQRLH